MVLLKMDIGKLQIVGKKTMKIPNDYMELSYRMEIVEDKDEGGIAAAMGSTMPTTANPTAQGMISVISFAVNVFIFAYILKRAKAQKKNPWKEEIFTDTRDYQEAMARAK